MAYFAKLGTGNIVEQVISINNSVITNANGVEQENLGVDFINKMYNTRDVWKQTSYNKNFRKNYAGIGHKYDQNRDAFIPKKQYNSWILNEQTCLWESPIPMPSDGQKYQWDESLVNWEIIE